MLFNTIVILYKNKYTVERFTGLTNGHYCVDFLEKNPGDSGMKPIADSVNDRHNPEANRTVRQWTIL